MDVILKLCIRICVNICFVLCFCICAYVCMYGARGTRVSVKFIWEIGKSLSTSLKVAHRQWQAQAWSRPHWICAVLCSHLVPPLFLSLSSSSLSVHDLCVEGDSWHVGCKHSARICILILCTPPILQSYVYLYNTTLFTLFLSYTKPAHSPSIFLYLWLSHTSCRSKLVQYFCHIGAIAYFPTGMDRTSNIHTQKRVCTETQTNT